MKNLTRSFYLLIFFFNIVNSQKIDGICQPVQNVGYDIEKLTYTGYTKEYIIEEKYKDIAEAKNLTPEELLKSQISATNNTWLSKNYGIPKKWSPEQFEKLHEEGNYLHLIGKLNIAFNNEEFAVVKFNMGNKEKTVPASLVMKKVDNSWVFSESSVISNLSFIFMSLSGNDLFNLFNNIKSKSVVINELINSSWELDVFHYSNFLNYYTKLLFDSKYEGDPKNYTKDFDENKVYNINKIKGLVPLIDQEYCSLFDNKLSNLNNPILKKLVKKVASTSEGKVTPLNYFVGSFSDQKTVYYLKYEIKQIDRDKRQEVAIFDQNFTTTEIKDAIYNLFINNSKEKLDNIFLESNQFISYSKNL